LLIEFGFPEDQDDRVKTKNFLKFKLYGGNLTEVKLEGADFRKADLSGAMLK
jgi:uncharacterized protein YjbI with pentapeptide repeats